MRGRLHHKFFAEIGMFSAIDTKKDPDGAGPLQSGFDDDFNEIMVFTAPDGARTNAREDEPSVFIPCIIETDSWEALQQYQAGNQPNTNIIITSHRKELERLELLNVERGEPLVRVNDRMLSIRDDCKRIIYKPRAPFYITQVRPAFGIGRTPDLFNFTLEDRENFAKS